MKKHPSIKDALAEAYEKELDKVSVSEESFDDDSETTEELDFDGDRYNQIHSFNDGILD